MAAATTMARVTATTTTNLIFSSCSHVFNDHRHFKHSLLRLIYYLNIKATEVPHKALLAIKYV